MHGGSLSQFSLRNLLGQFIGTRDIHMTYREQHFQISVPHGEVTVYKNMNNKREVISES